MSTGPSTPSFRRLAAINILANLTVPLAGLVDLAMLGRLDDIRFLAGVALGSVVFDYVYWSLGFLRMATTGTTAQAVGRGDTTDAFLILYRSLAVAVTVGLALWLLRSPLITLSLRLLDGTPPVEAAARAYFDARIIGAPATLVGLVFLGWFLGRAESRVALLLTAVANLANIALNYVFILRLDLAARGAGLATALSQYLLVAVALVCFARRYRAISWRWATLFGREALGDLLRLQRDILLRTLCLTTTFALFTNASAVLGTAWLAANTLVLRVVSTAAYLVDGAAFATETLAGILHGRNDRDGLRALLHRGLAFGFVLAAVIVVPVVLAPELILGGFTHHRDVVERAVSIRWWLVPVLLVGSAAYIYDGFFLGLTRAVLLRNAMAISFVCFLLPAGLATMRRDVHLLWAALAAFMLTRTLLLWRASIATLDA